MIVAVTRELVVVESQHYAYVRELRKISFNFPIMKPSDLQQ
jgi:hypothetical protein